MSSTYPTELKSRLQRIEGQLRGVVKMMDEGKSCKDVVAQMKAVRNATDKAIAQIVAANLKDCLINDVGQGQDPEKLVNEAIELLVKST